jgi:hypothetical protein
VTLPNIVYPQDEKTAMKMETGSLEWRPPETSDTGVAEAGDRSLAPCLHSRSWMEDSRGERRRRG